MTTGEPWRLFQLPEQPGDQSCLFVALLSGRQEPGGSRDSQVLPAGGLFHCSKLLWWRITGVEETNLKGYNFVGRE